MSLPWWQAVVVPSEYNYMRVVSLFICDPISYDLSIYYVTPIKWHFSKYKSNAAFADTAPHAWNVFPLDTSYQTPIFMHAFPSQ